MTDAGLSGLKGFRPRRLRVRAGVLLAALLALTVFLVSPRSIQAVRAAAGRHHDTKRAKVPRHHIPNDVRPSVRTGRAARPSVCRGEDSDRLKGILRAGARISARSISTLTKPDYLKPHRDPHRPFPPPA